MTRNGLLLFAIMLYSVSAQITNLSTDRSSLAALKLYVTSDPKNILKNGWSDSTSVCNWTGVTCGGDRVIGLDLSNAALVGTVPPHLGNLSSLVDLRFINNSFHGALPSQLSRLRKLRVVDFVSNGLSEELPDWLGALPELRSLLLYGNKLSGSIPTAIFNATLLETIDLSYNHLSGKIPKQIGNLVHLKTLALASNKFTEIPQEISSLQRLETLNVMDNSLKSLLPLFVFNMSSLKTINMIRNELNHTLPHNICQHLPIIQEIYFGTNNLSGHLPSKLWQCKNLSVLVLSKNNFSGAIPTSIGNLTNLREVYLQNNMFTGTLPDEIGKLRNLVRLAIEFNNITGVVPPGIFNITTIQLISLTANQLWGGLPSNIGRSVPNLERLFLNGNNFAGPLPDISNATKLTFLELSHNHFSGSIPDKMLSSLTNLQILNFASNNLTIKDAKSGTLSSIATSKHLRAINFAGNPLNVALPDSIGSNISNSLESLYFDSCELSGDIPDSLSNLSSLILLSLGRNRLSGSIPASIGRLLNIQALSLPSTGLSGPIPFELCQLKSLYLLDLRENLLSGSIPPCFENATSLRIMYLQSNKLTSTIPSTIWRLEDILTMNLSSNSLVGSLSSNIGNLKVVTYVNIGDNQLSGNISSTIGGLKAIAFLSLKNNKFEGSIPESLGNALSLSHLDLSNNNLSGLIPKSLEKLSNLKFLNLSFNKLYGEIPTGGPFKNFSSESFIHNGNLCGESRLQVPPCKSSSKTAKKSNKALVLKWVLPSTFVALVMTVLLIVALRMKRSQKHDSEVALVTSDQQVLDNVTRRRVSRSELLTATNGFKEENLIGIGSFGSVYKGTLSDGLVVAVKVFNLELEEAFESFATECDVLCNIRHHNLVKVITCCSSPDFKALVLEYMTHGSLEKWLYSDGLSLNLLQRLDIMIDVAAALEYLHCDYSTPIVHCDLKPSNVLLDENMVAHVSDFGVAKILRGDDSVTHTMTLATIGYMAPEYGVEGIVSRKGDVYSFGIMLMEVFTRKKPVDEMFNEEMSLKQWVQNSFHNSITEVIDPDLLGSEDCMSSLMELALTCSASSPNERIDMKSVVTRLNKIKMTFFKNNVFRK